MQRYLSPLYQLNIEDIDVSNKASMTLAKKKLLAEIDLSPTHTVMIGRNEMTKDDILKAFDHLGKVDNWEYHRLIASDPILLRFLLESKLEKGVKFAPKTEYENEAFIKFISPYFAYSYTQRILVCFEKRQPKLMNTLMYDNPFMVITADADIIWEEIEHYLNKKVDTLDEMTEQMEIGIHFTDTEIIPFHATGMMECLNMLPKGDLDYIIDKYAMAMYNFSAVAWNKKERYRAIEVINHAQMLSVGDNERKMIEERIGFFDEQMDRINGGVTAQSSNSGEGSGLSIGTIFWIIFIIIRIIMAISR